MYIIFMLNELPLQPPGEVTCTIFGLALGLHIAGTEASVLIPILEVYRERILRTGIPLSTEEKMQIARECGYQSTLLSTPAKILYSVSDFDSMLNYFLSCTRSQVVVLMAISGLLAKYPNEQFLHQVVAQQKGNRISIVDPFDPRSPEVFDLSLEAGRRRLTLWIASAGLQQLPRGINELNNDKPPLPNDLYFPYIRNQELFPLQECHAFLAIEANFIGVKYGATHPA